MLPTMKSNLKFDSSSKIPLQWAVWSPCSINLLFDCFALAFTIIYRLTGTTFYDRQSWEQMKHMTIPSINTRNSRINIWVRIITKNSLVFGDSLIHHQHTPIDLQWYNNWQPHNIEEMNRILILFSVFRFTNYLQ